jgi:hypothetical protein
MISGTLHVWFCSNASMGGSGRYSVPVVGLHGMNTE